MLSKGSWIFLSTRHLFGILATCAADMILLRAESHIVLSIWVFHDSVLPCFLFWWARRRWWPEQYCSITWTNQEARRCGFWFFLFFFFRWKVFFRNFFPKKGHCCCASVLPSFFLFFFSKRGHCDCASVLPSFFETKSLPKSLLLLCFCASLYSYI